MAEGRFDVSRRFVRVTEKRQDGFVEFEFAVGEPGMAVELVMPQAAFESFCAANQAVFLQPRIDTGTGTSDWAWTLRDATQQRFR
jgi:phenol hydroxylase P0 protein